MAARLTCDMQTLQMVTNVLYRRGGILHIKYPPLGTLARCSQRRGRMKVELTPRAEYDRIRDEVCSREPTCEREIPRYDQLMEVFYASGIPPLDHIETMLVEKISGRNVLMGDKPLWIGYDTCVLRRRFYSQVRRMLETRRLNTSIGHAVTEGVNDELLFRMDRKYSQRDIACFERIFPDARMFLNRATLEARLHRLGLADLGLMRSREVYQELPSGTGDLEIIRGYAGFEKNRNAELLLFSADNNFVQTATDKSLQCHYVPYHHNGVPEYLGSGDVPLNALNDLLYHFAVVCGLIRVQGITIASIWPNKTVNHWKEGLVQVEASGPAEEEVLREHTILTRMKEMGLY